MFTKRYFFILLGIILITLRFYNLLALPLYLDEGIYIFWSKLFQEDSSFAYVSLQDGKTPLFMWITTWLQPFMQDFLLTARFISVFSGTISILCWTLITKIFFGAKSAIWAFFILLIIPYGLLVERMGFTDSLLVGFSNISLLLLIVAIKCLQKRNLQFMSIFLLFLAGIFLGLSYFTKTSAKLFLVSQVIVFIFLLLSFIPKKNYKAIAIGLFSLALMIFTYKELVGYMRVGGYRIWAEIAIKEAQLSFTFAEIPQQLLHNPIFYFKNLLFSSEYLLFYFGGFLLLFFYGVFLIIKQNKERSWIVLYTILLYLGILLSAKVMASRYFYVLVAPVCVIAAIGAVNCWSKKNILSKILVLGSFLLAFVFSFQLIVKPLYGFYAKQDRELFVSGEFSALGLYDVINDLNKNKKNSIVGVSATWGVKEGSRVLLDVAGIETVDSTNVVVREEIQEGVECSKNNVKLENYCYRWNTENIDGSNKPNKYLYLTGKFYDLDFFRKLRKFEIVKEFSRPYSNYKVYLIKI